VINWYLYITNKLKYDSFLQSTINALKLIRIYIYPYIIYREHKCLTKKTPQNDILQEFEISLAQKKDMEQILYFPDRMDRLEKLHTRLKRGDLCIAAWSEGKIVAFSWANLKLYDFLYSKYKLNENEAYLYDAYTASAYRGKKISYYLRNHFYKLLNENGIDVFHSVSIKSNKSAIRFKKNIHARIIEHGLHINIFNKWHYHKELEFEKSRTQLV